MKRLGGFAIALVCSASALADSYRNCQQEWHLPHTPPARIVALNQHAADMLLALEAGPALVGVAYLDDNGAAHKQGTYFAVPVIAPRYPASEVLYGQQPDLVVGGFATAFGSGITSRTGLAGNGVASYLLESACAGHSLDYFGHIRNDLLTLGKLLRKPQRARELIDTLDADLASAQALAKPAKPLSVFYLDSEVNGLDSEGRQGFVTTLLAAAGAHNILAGINQYRVTVSSETLLMSDPDVILLSRLRAVPENRMIDIPFTHLVPTVGSGKVVLELAHELNTL